MSTSIAEVKQTSFSLAPQNLEEAFKFAEILSKSKLVPKDFEGNQGNILVAIQWGAELGLQPMQAMQNIAVINGRPSLWGDSVIALVKASPLCEYVVEDVNDKGATCRVKRRGEPEQIRTFTPEDARAANLWGKQGPWTQYPKRMMQMRARSWALRDVFPDVLRGMPVAEELMDMPVERDVTPAPQPKAADTASKAVENLAIDEFLANESAWKRKWIRGSANGLTIEHFRAWVTDQTGKHLTDDMVNEVLNWKADAPKQPEVIDGQATNVPDNRNADFLAGMAQQEAAS